MIDAVSGFFINGYTSTYYKNLPSNEKVKFDTLAKTAEKLTGDSRLNWVGIQQWMDNFQKGQSNVMKTITQLDGSSQNSSIPDGTAGKCIAYVSLSPQEELNFLLKAQLAIVTRWKDFQQMIEADLTNIKETLLEKQLAL